MADISIFKMPQIRISIFRPEFQNTILAIFNIDNCLRESTHKYDQFDD